jgi:hypothetical protein
MRASTSAIAMIDLLAIAFLLAESTWENPARSFSESARCTGRSQAAILSALRKRNGGMLTGEGAPARWRLAGKQ